MDPIASKVVGSGPKIQVEIDVSVYTTATRQRETEEEGEAYNKGQRPAEEDYTMKMHAYQI